MRGIVALSLLVASVVASGSTSALGQDPVADAFTRCKYWYEAPTQPGLVVVACDQRQLDRFIASDLTDPGEGGARIAGPYGRPDGVPAVYATEDPDGLGRVRVTGSGHRTGLYVAAFGEDGMRRTATFPATALPNGVRLRVSWDGERAQLVSPSGRQVAAAKVRTVLGPPFPMLPRPRQVAIRAVDGRIAVTWLAAEDTVYAVGSGATRGGARSHSLVQVREGRAGRRRVVVRPERGDRWIGVWAIRDSTFSRTVTRRLPR
jgi:hypothetical protein